MFGLLTLAAAVSTAIAPDDVLRSQARQSLGAFDRNSAAAQGPATSATGNRMLSDLYGRSQSLATSGDDRLLVVAFLGVECPLANLYAGRLNELAANYAPRGVRFLAVDPNAGDDLSEIQAFAARHELRFPFVKDVNHRAVDRFAATRTPEVFVVDLQGVVRYRGRIDDQYLVGVQRTHPTTNELREALDELLAGREVSVSETVPTGCLITRDRRTAGDDITYAEHISPLMQSHCVRCHRPGYAAPMSLQSYDDVKNFAAMIDEVVTADRMPPWHADGEHGRFADDPRLTAEKKNLLRQWIGAGCPPGDLQSLPKIASPADDGWTIGPPDAVISIPEAFRVPARGIVDYHFYEVDPGFTEDRWVSAVEVRPGNRAVVHHCNVFLRPPGSDDVTEAGSLGSVCLAAMAVGTPAAVFPEGMAKRIPAGWRLLFAIHYVAVGTEQTDRTSIGLRFADPASVTREVATRLLVDHDLQIPPHTADHRVEHAERFDRDVLLLAMFPHLHLRGKSFRYEVVFPDGSRETLLNVPHWDFSWQHRYQLAEPKHLPAGTVLHCIAHYDNSSANPANPDPAATVRTGPRNEDEMFNGYYDVALAEPEYPTRSPRQPTTGLAMIAVLLGGALAWRTRRRRVN